MIHELKCKWLETIDELGMLADFAKSSGHEFYFDPRLHKVVVFFRPGGEWIGYAIQPKAKLMLTAWHPNICKANDIAEAFRMISGHSKLEYGHCLVTVPNHTKTFPVQVMGKYGFYPLNCQVYESNAYH